MANLAQEEADRLFNQTVRIQTHPEDHDDSDRESADEKEVTQATFVEDDNQGSDDDDNDVYNKLANLSTGRSTYTLPATEQYANTGPKGVIADAQSFARAKQDALSFKPLRTKATNFVSAAATPRRAHRPGSDDGEGNEADEDDDDDNDEFMNQWRARRIAEMSAGPGLSDGSLQPRNLQQRRASPSRRTYGSAVRVDALGYLDAIEKVSSDTIVVVLIYNSASLQSAEVEEEIDILAYKHGHVRFVKLSHEVADMEHVAIPALLVYRAGDVLATISGAKSEGVEQVLSQQGVFS